VGVLGQLLLDCPDKSIAAIDPQFNTPGGINDRATPKAIVFSRRQREKGAIELPRKSPRKKHQTPTRKNTRSGFREVFVG
jgi:hypothetical protein